MLITKLVATLEDGRQYSVEATKGEGFETMARVLQGVVERNTGHDAGAAAIRKAEAIAAKPGRYSPLPEGHPERWDS